VFVKWDEDSSTDNPRASETMDSPKTFTADYKTQYKLTIQTSGLPAAYPTNVYLGGLPVGTASDISPYNKWFDAGTPTGTVGVDDIVSGATGTRYVFVKWDEDSSTDNPRASETMDSPKTFTADYKTQYYLTVNTSPAGIVAIPGEGWYDNCTEVTLTAFPLEIGKYLFDSWKVDDNIEILPIIDVHMDGPKTATAVYKNYLGHAKEEIDDLKAYLTDLRVSGDISKREYEHFIRDLDRVEKDIDKAIKNFDRENRKGYDDKMKGFDDLRRAVMKLRHMIRDVDDWAKRGRIPAGDAAWIISELETLRMKLVNKARGEALAERALALKAIENAKAQGRDTTRAEEEIVKVDRELAKAAQNISEGKLAQAIQHLKHAFAHSHHAIKKAYDPTWDIDYKDWIDELEEMDP
jgi:hypothetical protein